MKNIQLNNVKYKVPESWDEVTLGHQINISKIAQEHTGLTSQLQLIAGYANIPVDVIKHTNIKKLPDLVKHLQFISEPVNQDPISEFTHRGHKYSVMQTLQNAEFQDFISLEAVLSSYKENPYIGLPMLIAILCKREGETLDDIDVEERSKEFLDLPFDTANRVSVFFSQLGAVSQINTPTFLKEYQAMIDQEAIKRLDELENTTKQSDGQGWLGRLQKWILRKYIRSLKKNYNSYLIGIQSKS